MKNKLEHILLSILLGLSVLLGLSFWLNTIFNFNIFCGAHWDEFAKLQATKTPIASGFYISFFIALFIFVVGVYFIYRSTLKQILKPKTEDTPLPKPETPAITQIEKQPAPQQQQQQPMVFSERPPRLNLPNNMAQIVAHNNTVQQKPKQQPQQPETNPYNPIISEVFSNNGYIVKPNPKISGFVPNLFAIGNNEVVWIGGVDCDIEKMMNGIQKLDSVFKETLEDITININAFVLDTMNKYNSENNSVLVFKSIEELKEFIEQHPADQITEMDQESFDSYSEYIDTIIQYIKNI